MPLLYDELRKLAAQMLTQERPGQTLQATALVHEAYVRLVGGEAAPSGAEVRGKIGAISSGLPPKPCAASSSIAPQLGRVKRGGGWRRLQLDEIDLSVQEPPAELLDLDEALEELAQEDPLGADLVKLRFFAGLTLEDAANTLGIARRTADRYWVFARSWLYDRLRQNDPGGES